MSKIPDFELNVTPEPPAQKARWIGQDFVQNSHHLTVHGKAQSKKEKVLQGLL